MSQDDCLMLYKEQARDFHFFFTIFATSVTTQNLYSTQSPLFIKQNKGSLLTACVHRYIYKYTQPTVPYMECKGGNAD